MPFLIFMFMATNHQHNITYSPCLAKIPSSGPRKVMLCNFVVYLNNVVVIMYGVSARVIFVMISLPSISTDQDVCKDESTCICRCLAEKDFKDWRCWVYFTCIIRILMRKTILLAKNNISVRYFFSIRGRIKPEMCQYINCFLAANIDPSICTSPQFIQYNNIRSTKTEACVPHIHKLLRE